MGAGTRCSSINRFHGGRDWLELRAGTRCSSLDGSQGTWLEFHRVINADRASMMHNHGSQGQKYADVGKHGLNVCRRRAGTRCTTLDPRAGSMHNHGSMGQHDAQPWIHGPEVCTTLDPWGQHDADVGKPGRLKESLSRVRTVPIGGDRSKRRRGTRRFSAFCPSSVRVNPDNSRS